MLKRQKINEREQVMPITRHVWTELLQKIVLSAVKSLSLFCFVSSGTLDSRIVEAAFCELSIDYASDHSYSHRIAFSCLFALFF